jgi:hypothetical protein
MAPLIGPALRSLATAAVLDALAQTSEASRQTP